jgi:hypothetical protein
MYFHTVFILTVYLQVLRKHKIWSYWYIATNNIDSTWHTFVIFRILLSRHISHQYLTGLFEYKHTKRIYTVLCQWDFYCQSLHVAGAECCQFHLWLYLARRSLISVVMRYDTILSYN